MLNKELLMMGGYSANTPDLTENEFQELADSLRLSIPNATFVFVFDPSIDMSVIFLDSLYDEFGTDVLDAFKVDYFGKSYSIIISQTSGISGAGPFELRFSDPDLRNYRFLYRRNDPTNQASIVRGNGTITMLNVPEMFDGYIVP